VKIIAKSFVLSSLLFCFSCSHASDAPVDTSLRIVRIVGGVALVGTSIGLEFLSQWLRKKEARLREIEKQNPNKKTQQKDSLYDSYYQESERSEADDYSIKSTLCAVLSKAACAAGGILIWVGANGEKAASPKIIVSNPSMNPNFRDDQF